jgi:putative NIF3 family GTP cyclohydrolase 1 type 2
VFAGALILALAAPSAAHPQASSGATAAPQVTARQVVERIQQRTGGPDLASWRGPTVDTVKAGDLDTPVTGVATTFSATMDVLKKAAARGANLVIAHEPTFYDHRDETAWLGDDPVLQEKLGFIAKHKLVVWRFHDHAHAAAGQPDRVLQGMVKALGWEAHQNAARPHVFSRPEIRLEDLAREIRSRLASRTLRVVGDRDLRVSRLAFVPGAAPRDVQVAAFREDVEAVVVGESREWETVLYAVDAAAQGRRKGLIVIGHDLSEEAGMRECADWLRGFVTEVPVEFLPAGEPFWAPE